MSPIRAFFVVFVISAFAMGSIAFSRASGIDCAKASDNVEMAICTEPGLAKIDSEMVDAYLAAMKRTTRKRELLVAQLHFIEKRSFCARVDCMYDRTVARIGELERWR